MRKVPRATYDVWAKQFADSFWSKTINWGHGFCNEFNVEDSELYSKETQIEAELIILDKYVSNSEETATTVRGFDWTDYPAVPEELRVELENYVNQGIEPQSFLVSVLINDLVGVLSYPIDDLDMLKQLVQFVHREMPYETWGTHKSVRSYMQRFGETK